MRDWRKVCKRIPCKEGGDHIDCAAIRADQVEQGFAAWTANRAYVDGRGNYHLRTEPATPTHHPRGPIAPWNRVVKAVYRGDVTAFHQAAHAWREASGE